MILETINEIVIRPLQEEDLPALEWGGEFSHFRRVYARNFKRMQKGLVCIWLVEHIEEGVIGQVFVQLSSKGRSDLADGKNNAYVYSFRVKPEFRGNGYGTQLMQAVEEDLINKGFSQVTLLVALANSGARRLYQNLGYQVSGVDPGRWFYEDQFGQRRDIHDPSFLMKKYI